MSRGAGCAMVHDWLLNMQRTLFQGSELPKIVNILTGWGKHSKVMGDGTLKRAIEALLNGMGSPFRFAENNMGRLTSSGDSVATWPRQPGVINMLVLYDVLNHSQPAGPSHGYPTSAYQIDRSYVAPVSITIWPRTFTTNDESLAKIMVR
ncbi:unnamed protein product [Vicia faba]|uniref:Smr domain-containing protein n=1 Tax=Vicia faba TaxID=3906 RepID=A0AAV0ZHS6_VICFA|nr:unnamed protein product [Vicia faba]